jgi:hypothetical protein
VLQIGGSATIEPSFGVWTSIAPLIRGPKRLTDQRIAGQPAHVAGRGRKAQP